MLNSFIIHCMKIGAHVSAAGGLHNAIDRAQEIGAECVQIFASSPRGWAVKFPTEEIVLNYREKSTISKIYPTFLHGIYLVNLGGKPEHVRKSVDSLTHHMNVADSIGAEGVIFHAGNHGGAGYDAIFSQTVDAITEVLGNSSPSTRLMVENSAGMGNHIGASFEELGKIISSVGSDRLKVCLDTQHTVAAGYELFDKDGLNRAMEEFDDNIGLERLAVVHANDSKTALGSGVDRHENIGQGHIGEMGFLNIISHTAFKNVPFVLEVPGFDGGGPDTKNVCLLKALRTKAGIRD